MFWFLSVCLLNWIVGSFRVKVRVSFGGVGRFKESCDQNFLSSPVDFLFLYYLDLFMGWNIYIFFYQIWFVWLGFWFLSVVGLLVFTVNSNWVNKTFFRKMVWLCIIISFILVWLAYLCKVRHASCLPSKVPFLNDSGKNPYKLFLIVRFLSFVKSNKFYLPKSGEAL